MLYNLDHAEDIVQCVNVSSNIRILLNIRVRVFVGGEKNPSECFERDYPIIGYNGTSLKEGHLSK